MNVFVQDRDFNDGYYWTVKVDSWETGELLLEKLQERLHNTCYAGTEPDVEIYTEEELTDNIVEGLAKKSVVTKRMVLTMDVDVIMGEYSVQTEYGEDWEE